jgi:DNA-binding response OmpR family regulator
VDVQLVRWPSQRIVVEELRAKGEPRLLLLDDGIEAPSSPDCLEDWIRMPSSDADLEARRRAVAVRAVEHAVRPTLDDAGVLRFRTQWIGLSPVERDLASALVDKFGAVVGRTVLSDRAWPDGSPSRNALDVHMLRLRRRAARVGLEVRTIRSRGYLLQAAPTHDGREAQTA